MNASQSIVQGLNPAQLRAVQHDPRVPLQILAGPGSGKTKVLTSRVAYLILHHRIDPASICAVTFTNKAANEMRARLKKLIGKENTCLLKLGTFHALCASFLRKYPQLIGLEGNFTICDADESMKIVKTLMKKFKEVLEERDVKLEDKQVQSAISKAKSKGLSAHDLRERNRTLYVNGNSSIAAFLDGIVVEIYEAYEKTLKDNNALDFDDLLLYGSKLFSQNRKAVSWCHHILVDEFQDTNVTQYEIMRALAVAKCLTIVGDPDQSIYGWRSAEIGNITRMQKDFPATQQIFLEQNYRSTSSILAACLGIVSQDKERVQKSLHTSHPAGITPRLLQFKSEQEESPFIAHEIKRLVAHSGGMLNWGDFVVLLRINSLSRAIEQALQHEGIPSRVLGGHKFFERLEVKDLLAYLQLVDNPSFAPAFSRAVNVPARGIGDKTLTEIFARADKANIAAFELVEKICDGRTPDIKPPVKKKLSKFVSNIQTLRDAAQSGTQPADLIRKLIDQVGYEEHLKKTQSDWESRWENVQELITFASDVDVEARPDNDASTTPLRSLLETSMLSSEGDKQNEEDNKDKVTLSTCHAAKGLEWPVVFIPAVEDGTFPFKRSDDIPEERRLLYVACTRAQSLLYLSHVANRKVAGFSMRKDLTHFISSVLKENPSLFRAEPPSIGAVDRQQIATVIERPLPGESEVEARVAEFNRRIALHPPTFLDPPQSMSRILNSDASTHRSGLAAAVLPGEPTGMYDWNRPPANDVFPRRNNLGAAFPTTNVPAGAFAFSSANAVPFPNRPMASSYQPPTPNAAVPRVPLTTSELTNAATSQQHSKSVSKPNCTNYSSVPNAGGVQPVPQLSRRTAKPAKSAPPPLRSPLTVKSPIAQSICPPTSAQASRPLAPSQPARQVVGQAPRSTAASPASDPAPAQTAGVKRRLGMGRTTGGYVNKKFKPPTC